MDGGGPLSFFFCGVLKHGDQCNALFKAMDSYVQTKELDPYHLKSLTVLSQVDWSLSGYLIKNKKSFAIDDNLYN